MSDKPVFVYAATYASLDDAEADYDTLLDLHDADLVGTYDVAIIDKDAEGKVVGTCGGGTKKIMYKREAAPAEAPAKEAAKP